MAPNQKVLLSSLDPGNRKAARAPLICRRTMTQDLQAAGGDNHAGQAERLCAEVETMMRMGFAIDELVVVTEDDPTQDQVKLASMHPSSKPIHPIETPPPGME